MKLSIVEDARSGVEKAVPGRYDRQEPVGGSPAKEERI